MRVRIAPYNMNSEGAKALKDAFIAAGHDALLLRTSGSVYSYRDGDLVINWGNGDCAIPEAKNKNIMPILEKKDFFIRLQGLGLTPRFALSKAEALRHLSFPIVCRTQTQGRDGSGIVVADNMDQLVDAPLFTEMVNKTSEYRVHVGRKADGSIVPIGSVKKIHSQSREGVDERIWVGDTTVFSSFGETTPAVVHSITVEAFKKFPELTFAAFDVAYDETRNVAYVLEANSAPMMTPETARRYAKFFIDNYSPAEPVVAPVVIESEPLEPYEPTHQDIGEVFNQLSAGSLTLREVIEGYIRATHHG